MRPLFIRAFIRVFKPPPHFKHTIFQERAAPVIYNVYGLYCRKRAVDIGDDVFDVFKAAAEAYHAAVDPRRRKLSIGELPVRRRCRMKHTGADIGDVDFIGKYFFASS